VEPVGIRWGREPEVGVHGLYVPDGTGADHLQEHCGAGQQLRPVRLHEEHRPLPCGLDQVPGRRQRDGHRLLDEHRRAGQQSGLCSDVVYRVDRRDVDGVDLRVGQHPLHRVRSAARTLGTVLVGERLGARRVAGGYRGQVPARRTLQGCDHDARDPARADKAPTDAYSWIPRTVPTPATCVPTPDPRVGRLLTRGLLSSVLLVTVGKICTVMDGEGAAPPQPGSTDRGSSCD